MKNILFLTQHINVGGLERMLVQTTLHLSQNYKPFVFVFDHLEKTTHLLPVLEENKIPFVAFKKAPRFSIQMVVKIIKYCIQNKISIIHCHDLGALIYGVFAKLFASFFGIKLKLIHTQHSFVHLEKGISRYKYYEKIFPRFADIITVVHAHLRDVYTQLGLPKNKIIVIENGAEFSECINAFEQAELRKKLLESILNNPELPKQNITENFSTLVEKHWVLSLSRLSDKKGTRDLVEIFNYKQDDNILLLLVGPEQSSGYISELFKNVTNPQVLFTGSTLTPKDWLKASDSVISASHYEGHSLTALEAIGSGLHLILSDIPGHQFFRQFNQLSIQYFSVQAPAKAARQINFNFKTSKSELYKKACVIRENFGIEKMTRQYEKLYEGNK